MRICHIFNSQTFHWDLHERNMLDCSHILHWSSTLETLQEERCGEAERDVGQVVRMQEEVELLQNALRDIAHAVIQDAEVRDTEQPHAAPHLHLTPAGPLPQRWVRYCSFICVQTLRSFWYDKQWQDCSSGVAGIKRMQNTGVWFLCSAWRWKFFIFLMSVPSGKMKDFWCLGQDFNYSKQSCGNGGLWTTVWTWYFQHS